MKNMFRKLTLVLSLLTIIALSSPTIILAGSLDDLSKSDKQSSNNSQSGNNDTAISDYLKGYNPVTEGNMESASQLAGPIATALGTISGFIVMVVSAGIFVITALDLAYIGIPPIRRTLNPNYGMSGGAGASPMGGMGMGGMGMGMRGMGMGGMGMQGGAQPTGGKVWVSDEAINAVMVATQGQQPQQGGMSPMGGMGMGMGGMGMGMQGGAQPQPRPFKQVALEYLKHRSLFLIIFTVCTVVLMSSIFTECGLNLSSLLMKIINKLNGSIANVGV